MEDSAPLSRSDIEHFLENGYVVIREAIPRDVAERGVEEAFARAALDRHAPETWPQKPIHLGGTRWFNVVDFAPKVWAATCQLLGGAKRIKTPYEFGNSYIMNLGWRADEPYLPPGPQCGGWHKDGDSFLHFLDSPEQGLLSIVAWTDVVTQGGPTFIAPDSVGVVARFLAEHPEGVQPNAFGEVRLIDQCARFTEATAQAGDVFLMHPYMLHTSSQNRLRVERIITNPPAYLKEPMQFNRENPADFSPVERAVLRGLGVERYDFRPTAPRQAVIPPRVANQARLLEQERFLAKVRST